MTGEETEVLTETEVIENEEVNEELKNKNFKQFCFSCYSFTELPKNEEFLKECEDLSKESTEKYHDRRAMRRAVLNGCQKCHRTLKVCCDDYVEFYKEKENKEEKGE